MSSSRPDPPSRAGSRRTVIQNLFSGRSSVGRDDPAPESPKTPRPFLRPQRLPSIRLVIPYLTRTPRNSATAEPPLSSRPITPNSLEQQTQQTQPPISGIPPQVRQNSRGRFVGVDLEAQQLNNLVHNGRRPTRRSRRNTSTQSDRHTCAPKIKNKMIRRKILTCIISGLVYYPESRPFFP